MNFVLLNPLFTWLLPLVAAPVVFHLFLRIRKRQRPFSTLMFFQRISPRLSARRKVKEWLVLLLRTLLILFLLLALLRPVWYGVGSTGGVAQVLVIDNSGSMAGLARGDKSKMQVAIEAAQALIGGQREQDSVGVVLLVEDPSVVLPTGLTSDKKEKSELLGAVTRIRETEASGAIQQAFERAVAMFENSATPRFEIHILTDAQEVEWNKVPVGMRPPRAGTGVYVHRITSLNTANANVAVMGLALPEKKILVGRRFPLRVELRNTSEVDGLVRLNWVDDAGTKSTQEVPVPKREDKTVVLGFEPVAPGVHWINVWVEGDGFGSDNKAGVAYATTEKKPVLFVGREEDFGLFPMAISPSGDGKFSGLVPAFVTTAELVKALDEKKPALVALSWPSLALVAGDSAAAATLKVWVERGGSLFVGPSSLGGGPPARTLDWLGAVPEAMVEAQQGFPVLAFQKGAAVFGELKDERGDIFLRNLRAFKFHPLKLEEKTLALFGLEDGRVFLAERQLGKGLVFTCGLGLDPTWSTLPLKGGFLALAQSMALLGGDAGAENLVSLTAGDKLLTVPPGATNLHLQSITGNLLDWKGEPNKRPIFPLAGVYAADFGGQSIYASVRASAREGEAQFVKGESVPALGTVAHVVRTFDNADAILAEVRKLSRAVDFFLPALLLGFLCLMAEGFLANPRPLKAAPPRAKPNPLDGATVAKPDEFGPVKVAKVAIDTTPVKVAMKA